MSFDYLFTNSLKNWFFKLFVYMYELLLGGSAFIIVLNSTLYRLRHSSSEILEGQDDSPGILHWWMAQGSF